MQTQIDDGKLKAILKEAVMEALEEKKNIFHDLIAEALEDIGLIRAIQEGERMESADKQDVFDILEGRA